MSTMTTDAPTLAEVDEALAWAWCAGDMAYVDRLLDLRLTVAR